jgi:DNA polymerase-4
VLYCNIPHFAVALARRDNPALEDRPLILVGPEGRVFGASAEAAACGVVAGMTAQTAEIRCPEARLLEADLARCRAEGESLFQLLEEASPRVEPHGWGAAYAELGDRSAKRSRRSLTRDPGGAVALCREIGQAVRRELGEALQPALGWDKSKFTALAAARRTQPGHLRVVDGVREQAFLRPLPVMLLPLAGETVQRLTFLGLHTLGQYAALPLAAVWQQFGRAGVVAHRCARGEDDRPVVPRWQAPQISAEIEFEIPLAERERLVAALEHLLSPLLAALRGKLQACGQIRLAVRFDDGSTQEQERTFLLPVTEEGRVVQALGQLLDRMRWTSAASGLSVVLEQIQDAVPEQLTLFPLEDEREGKLRQVERYLAARFGANRLRRAMMTQPGAPLPEWRASWLERDDP